MNEVIFHLGNAAHLNNLGHLEKALEAVPGVASVEINPEGHTAHVHYENADTRKLLHVLQTEGVAASND